MRVPPIDRNDFMAQYRDSRLFLEWTKALDDYGIVWEDVTTGPVYGPQLHLSHQDVDLHLTANLSVANGRNGLVGNREGRFARYFLGVLSPGLLLWCNECQKPFFQDSTLYACPVCMNEETWVVEEDRLGWFGYTGKVNFHPSRLKYRSQQKTPEELHMDALNENALARILAYPSSSENREGQPLPPVPPPSPPPPPPKSDLFDDALALSADHRENGTWEGLKKALSGPARVHGWPAIEAIEDLARLYPNFSEVCGAVLDEVRLAPYLKDARMRLPNLLIVGSPSCGKSSFCKRLAQILAPEDWEVFALGQAPADFELVGSDSSFKKAKEGRVLKLLASDQGRPVRNPVLVLDELDKVNSERQFTVLPALLSLLEKNDAKHFRDAFFGVPVDASGIQFLATANDRHLIPGPLASRFELFQVADYSPKEFEDVVIPNIYRDWLGQFHQGTFPAELSVSTRQLLAQQAAYVPRRVEALLVRLANEGWRELSPAPTFESLGLAKEVPCQPDW